MDILFAAADLGAFTIDQMWASMGLFAKSVVIFLLAMSLATATIFVERLIVFFSAVKQSRLSAVALQKLLPEGKWDEARKMADAFKNSHLAKIVSAGAADVAKAYDVAPVDRAEGARRAMDRTRDREIARFRRGLGVLATVGSTAPFVGLLGTVVGIVNAFKQIAATGSGGLASVSAGISEALITTAIGLLVAIPAVMAFNYLSSVADRLALDMSDAMTEFYDFVVRTGSKSAASPLRQVQG